VKTKHKVKIIITSPLVLFNVQLSMEKRFWKLPDLTSFADFKCSESACLKGTGFSHDTSGGQDPYDKCEEQSSKITVRYLKMELGQKPAI